MVLTRVQAPIDLISSCYLALLFRNTIFLFIPGCSPPPKIARLKVEYFDMNTWVKRTALLEETPNLW